MKYILNYESYYEYKTYWLLIRRKELGRPDDRENLPTIRDELNYLHPHDQLVSWKHCCALFTIQSFTLEASVMEITQVISPTISRFLCIFIFSYFSLLQKLGQAWRFWLYHVKCLGHGQMVENATQSWSVREGMQGRIYIF